MSWFGQAVMVNKKVTLMIEGRWLRVHHWARLAGIWGDCTRTEEETLIWGREYRRVYTGTREQNTGLNT